MSEQSQEKESNCPYQQCASKLGAVTFLRTFLKHEGYASKHWKMDALKSILMRDYQRITRDLSASLKTLCL